MTEDEETWQACIINISLVLKNLKNEENFLSLHPSNSYVTCILKLCGVGVWAWVWPSPLVGRCARGGERGSWPNHLTYSDLPSCFLLLQSTVQIECAFNLGFENLPKFSLKDVVGCVKEPIRWVPRTHYPLLPLKTIPRPGTQLSEPPSLDPWPINVKCLFFSKNLCIFFPSFFYPIVKIFWQI